MTLTAIQKKFLADNAIAVSKCGRYFYKGENFLIVSRGSVSLMGLTTHEDGDGERCLEVFRGETAMKAGIKALLRVAA